MALAVIAAATGPARERLLTRGGYETAPIAT
jgi:hypothetical protein